MNYVKMEVLEVGLDANGVYDGYAVLSGKPQGLYVLSNDVWVVDKSGGIYVVFYGLDTYFPLGFGVESDSDKTEAVRKDDKVQQTEQDFGTYDSVESSQITQKFLLNVLAVAQDPSLIKHI